MNRWIAFLVVGVWLGTVAFLPAGTFVQFRTIAGDLEVELLDQDKPVTVRNFLGYMRAGAYENTFFHRCLPGFIVQGGGFTVTAANRPRLDWFVYCEAVPERELITNEFNVGRRFSNTLGTLAMAKLGGNPNSASSQWFFNLGNNSTNLDNQNGGFTVFGRVVGGLPVLYAFNALRLNNGIVNLTNWYGPGAGVFSDLPVRYSGFFPPYYNELIYVDISLLNVQVRAGANGGPAIAWNSIANRLHHVEFTTQFPPAWQTLTNVTGTGGRLEVADPTVDPRRFYRVRVGY